MKQFVTISTLLFAVLISSISFSQTLTFTRIDTGIVATNMGSETGSCWGDYDIDGLMDLFVSNFSLSGTDATNFLYHNEGSGYFTKVESGTIVEQLGSHGWTPAWGDYDNDGHLDIIVPERSGTLYLFQNDGNNGFNRIIESPLSDLVEEFRACNWIDLNRDGNLDLLLGNVSNYNFLTNQEAGNFIEVNNNFLPSFNHSGNTTSFFWADYDNDGDDDAFISVLYHSNFFYINNGDGTFTLDESGQITDDYYSFGGIWGDCNNDGFLDLYVFNGYDAVTNSLYLNNGDGSFEKITSGSVVTDEGDSYESNWGDFDNDGDLDLFVSNFGRFGHKNCYYQNDGSGEFLKITEGVIVSESTLGNNTCDFDNDGDLDIFLFNGGAMGEAEPDYFYMNNGNDNNWLNIKLIGTVSNTTGIGARLKLKATIFSNEVWQLREVNDRNLRAHFGLGDASQVDSLIVQWPCGQTQVLANIAVNQFLEITEPIPNHDVAAIPVFRKSNQVTLFTYFKPEIMVKNFGTYDESNVAVSYEITLVGGEGHVDTQAIELLKMDSLKTIMFAPFGIYQTGDYNLNSFTELINDEIRSNDTLRSRLVCTNLVDDFESDVSKWNFNNSGSGISGAFAYESTSSLNVKYENDVKSWAEFTCQSDLSRTDHAYLSFWSKTFLEPNKDFANVEISTDGGTSWNQIGESFTGVTPAFENKQISLDSYCGTGFEDVRFRFAIIPDAATALPGWFIDDISIHAGIAAVQGLQNAQAPETHRLFENYPNPFNASTVIQYHVPEASDLKIVVYNILGKEIATLVDRHHKAGIFRVSWDGKDNKGQLVPSGIYFTKLMANGFSDCKKMMLVQ